MTCVPVGFSYLSNGITYMKMVAKRAPGIHEHPVIKRIVQFDNVSMTYKSAYTSLLPLSLCQLI